MKTSYSVLLVLLLSLFSSLHATNYTNNGTAAVYNLNNGDTLRIANNTFNGYINSFTKNSVVIVSAGAVFNPISLTSPSGKIVNYGVCVFGNLATFGGFSFVNFGVLNVLNDVSLYDGGGQEWINNTAAIMNIGGNFSMNKATLTNHSVINITNNLSLYSANSDINNMGQIVIGGSLNMSNGNLNNLNKIQTKDFNAWGGEVNNKGELAPSGTVVFNHGTKYTNECLLITNAGFTNYGSFTNEGLLWVGRSGTSNDHFLNSGTFTNSASASVRTVKLTNYSTLNGGGSYYITGDSYTSGTVGKSGNTSDTIKIFDVTRTGSSFFDTQWGTVHANVVFKTLAMPDTNTVNYSGCSSYFRSNLSVPLPIEWNYFNAQLVQNKPVLSWSAQYEANTKFEVERSYDNVNFTNIATVISNPGKTYAHIDAAASDKNTAVYYRIKATSAANGGVKYTETKTLRISGSNSSPVAIYPNPVKTTASIHYNSDKNEPIAIRVSNIAGQPLLTKNVVAAKGANTFHLAETALLKAGNYFVEIINANSVKTTERFIKN